MNRLSPEEYAKVVGYVAHTLQQFESVFHTEITNWIIYKLQQAPDNPTAKSPPPPPPPIANLEILDISSDGGIFSELLADKHRAVKLVCAVRGGEECAPRANVQMARVGLDETDGLRKLGRFDVVVVKDATHEASDLAALVGALARRNLKNANSRVVLLTRPKNPPLPIPETAVELWRKYAPTREQIIDICQQNGLELECYSASCPIRVSRDDWAIVLRSGCLPAVKDSPKCTLKEIQSFIASRPVTMQFEEKIFIFVIWPKNTAT